MPNGYLQEERFQKPNIRITSLSQLTLRETNHSNWVNKYSWKGHEMKVYDEYEKTWTL